jgi:hypothetical protein
MVSGGSLGEWSSFKTRTIFVLGETGVSILLGIGNSTISFIFGFVSTLPGIYLGL